MRAGPFLPWLDEVRLAIRGEGETDVACGTCTACCASSQFVHVEPDEHDALAHIPKALRFPAPGLPKGHVLLGYDERGRCPMLGEHGCTIYDHRPRTCRTYDCRVFPAAGIAADKPLIAERASQWAFDHPTDADRDAHDEVRRAAAGLDPSLPATQRAVLAVRTGGSAPDRPAGDPGRDR